MIEPADMARIVRDMEAGFAVNDNLPWPRAHADEDEGIYAFMRETRASLLRWLGYALFAAVVFVGCIAAFKIGHGAGGML